MSKVTYTLVSNEGDAAVTVFVPGDPNSPYSAGAGHPNFKAIVARLVADDTENIGAAFDVGRTITEQLRRLTDRVSVQGNTVLFDGDPIHSSIASQILRFLRAGEDDWKPLVRFIENLGANPNPHSREQLYEWLDRHDFTITSEGNILGYKGVRPDAEHGFVSISSGPAVVDGVPVNGHVPNRIGSTVEMARGDVVSNPSIGCSRGLHVGTYEYAKGFAQGALLEVHFNPRDVVSVPTDCNAQKVRVCRYTVVDIIEDKVSTPLLGGLADDPEDDDFVPDEWFDATFVEDVRSEVEQARTAINAVASYLDAIE